MPPHSHIPEPQPWSLIRTPLRHLQKLSLVLLASLGCAHADAEAEPSDSQIWLSTTIKTNGDKSSRLHYALEGQIRLSDRASSIGTLLIRPSVGWRLKPDKTIAIGYAYVDSPGSKATEHRAWQEFGYHAAGFGRGSLKFRTRLEQRWRSDRAGPVWRMRQRLSYSHDLPNSTASLLVSDEIFLKLNESESAPFLDYEQNWLFSGLDIPFDQRASLKVGYQLIHSKGEAMKDSDHVILVSLTKSL